MMSGSTSLTPLKNNTALPGINYHFGQSRTTTCDPQVSNGAAMHKVQEALHVNTLPYGRILASLSFRRICHRTKICRCLCDIQLHGRPNRIGLGLAQTLKASLDS
jgi:hypothetical protein